MIVGVVVLEAGIVLLIGLSLWALWRLWRRCTFGRAALVFVLGVVDLLLFVP